MEKARKHFILTLLCALLGSFVLRGGDDRQEVYILNSALRERVRSHALQQLGDNLHFDRTVETPAWNIQIIEDEIDRLLKGFGKRVSKQLQAVRLHLSEVEDFAAHPETDLMTSKSRKQELERALGRLAKAAGSLRSSLAWMFSEYPTGCDYAPKFGAEFRESPEEVFREVIRLFRHEFSLAGEQIDDLIFEPSHTVTVDQLQDREMIVHLHRLKILANGFREELRRM